MLEIRDVVMALGPAHAERVVLRGADLRVAPGEVVLLTGLADPVRRQLCDLLLGLRLPRYGHVVRGQVAPSQDPGQPGVVVVDVGDRPDSGSCQRLLGQRSDRSAVVLLAGTRPPHVRVTRELVIEGGRIVAA